MTGDGRRRHRLLLLYRRMMRGRAGAIGFALLVAVSAMTGCSPQPGADDWVLTPVRYDNRMEGETGRPDLIDVTFPMGVTSDTAGGFWGFSSGSWVHIDVDGETVRRFNLDGGAPRGPVAAISPTVLVLSEEWAGTGIAGRLVVFDTEEMTWTELHRDTRPLGGIAVADEDVYFVAHALGSEAMTVERLPLDGGEPPVAVTAPVPEIGPSALAVGGDGRIHLATQGARYTFDPEGTLQETAELSGAFPAVAANGRGDTAWSGQGASDRHLPAFVDGGSEQARSIIESVCTQASHGREVSTVHQIDVVMRGERSPLPLLCAPTGYTWLTDDELLISVGGEGGGVLVRADPPH